jgi:MFS family permease
MSRRQGDLLASLSLAGLGFAIASLGPCVALLARDLDEPADNLAWLSSAFAVGLLVIAAVGPLVLRTDARVPVLQAGALVCASGAVLLAVAQGLIVALLGGLLVGLGGALMLLVVPLMLNGPDAAVRIARANAISSGLSILAPLLIGALDTQGPTGRLAVLLAIPPLLVLVALTRPTPSRPLSAKSPRGTDVPQTNTLEPATAPRIEGFGIAGAAAGVPDAAIPRADGLGIVASATGASGVGVPQGDGAGAGQPDLTSPGLVVLGAARGLWGTVAARWVRVVLAVGVEFCFVIWAVARLVATGLPAATAALLGSVFPLGMAIGRMIGPVRLGRTSALLPGSAVAAAGAVLVCSTNSPVLVTIGLGLAGLGVATLYPITVADLIGTPGARPAHLASLSAFASGIAILVAPAVLAALANVVDLRTAFLITLPLLAILLTVRVRRPDPALPDQGNQGPDKLTNEQYKQAS